MFDVVLKGGEVIDGTGARRFRGDVGIVNDRIAAVGNLEIAEALKRVDISGKIICPGFVDVHTHLDAQVFWDGTLYLHLCTGSHLLSEEIVGLR